MSDDGTVSRDVPVNFSPEARAVMQCLAVTRGIAPAAVLSEALGLMKTLTEARAAGERVLLEKHGHVEELAVPRGKSRTRCTSR